MSNYSRNSLTPRFVCLEDTTGVANISGIYKHRAEAAYIPEFAKEEKQNALGALVLAEKINALGIEPGDDTQTPVAVLELTYNERFLIDKGRELQRYGQVFLM
jgi:hypothetical protein